MGKFSIRYAVAMTAIVALSLGRANATPVTLTFEGLQNLEPVMQYYNGGLGGDGSGPGPNYGVTFGSDSLAIIDSSAGGTGNTGNDPSGSTVLFFLGGPGDVMDVPAGFDTGFSFYYSAPVYAGSVTVWSGPDGGGSLLATLSLPLTPLGSPAYSVWDPIGVSFAGTAESVIFSGTANYIAFDNVTLGASTPGNGNGPSVPEPSSALALLIGCASCGMLAARRRRR